MPEISDHSLRRSSLRGIRKDIPESVNVTKRNKNCRYKLKTKNLNIMRFNQNKFVKNYYRFGRIKFTQKKIVNTSSRISRGKGRARDRATATKIRRKNHQNRCDRMQSRQVRNRRQPPDRKKAAVPPDKFPLFCDKVLPRLSKKCDKKRFFWGNKGIFIHFARAGVPGES